MLLITLLVVINLFNAQPKRKFTTKLDEYLLLCIVFIVGAVLEYALVLAIMEYDKSVFFKRDFRENFRMEWLILNIKIRWEMGTSIPLTFINHSRRESNINKSSKNVNKEEDLLCFSCFGVFQTFYSETIWKFHWPILFQV